LHVVVVNTRRLLQLQLRLWLLRRLLWLLRLLLFRSLLVAHLFELGFVARIGSACKRLLKIPEKLQRSGRQT
jgi:hypothetical protein